MQLQVERIFSEPVKTRSSRLPERLGRAWRTLLVSGDIAVVIFVMLVALDGDGNRFAAALLSAAIVCGVFWQCGFYKRSYAVTMRDEAYYACTGIAIAAIPVALFLAVLGNFTVWSIVLGLAFCALGTSALRMRLHLERRAAAVNAGIDSITPGAWHDRESSSFRLRKRLFDVSVALVATIVFFPVMLAAAIAIAIESGFPVLFY